MFQAYDVTDVGQSRTIFATRPDSHSSQIDANSQVRRLYKRQCTGASTTSSFDIEGGKAAIFKLAISLGDTESLASAA